jgi:prepilin-type N-terminal cleavage/methylation domain-containing protein
MGLTLIELLIVIVVLGILASVVLFALGGVSASAEVASCEANAKEVAIAVQEYRIETGGTPQVTAQLLTSGPTPFLQSFPAPTSSYVISIVNGVVQIAAPAGHVPVPYGTVGACGAASTNVSGSTTLPAATTTSAPLATTTSTTLASTTTTSAATTTTSAATTTTAQVPTSFTSATSAIFTIGSSGTFSFTTSGSPVATLRESGSLPPGVTFVPNSSGGATLSGTPRSGPGNHRLTIWASNGKKTITQSFTLVVDQVPTFLTASSATLYRRSSGRFYVRTSGTPSAALSVSGSLPSGVSFVGYSYGRAVISVNSRATAGTYSFTITAHNSAGSATQPFTLSVK